MTNEINNEPKIENNKDKKNTGNAKQHMCKTFFSFDGNFLTPCILPIFFYVSIAIQFLYAIKATFFVTDLTRLEHMGRGSMDIYHYAGTDIVSALLIWVSFFIGIIVTKIIFEMILVLFRINKNLTEISVNTKK